ncbi:MAG: glutamine-hydrolyzing carbamoyl-phosphate synthase small subunit [Salinisphaeraceae bacterium]|nr:glutamine-hydrolyzing carbamoyl-phosphate synthase small subunit [Salinisphaeraceae bacterium]
MQPAVLVLADGSVFHGVGIGAEGKTVGEVVFNTAMTGYQEILTDPSYKQQIVTLTYPHIGNVGTNDEDAESTGVHAAGLIIRETPRNPSNWRNQQSLPDYLKANNTVAIAEIDTRRLTRILREKGAQNGCILVGEDADAALAEAKAFPGLKGADLAQVVTTDKAYEWREGRWVGPDETYVSPDLKRHVVVYDFGVKHNILRCLVEAGCHLTVVPAKTPASEVLAMNPDGIMLSNGPGDPEPCDYAIEAAKEIMAAKKPVMGICLGHQILGLACGAKTLKMKFGHHGANHPVQDLATKQVWISSQNHGFAVDEASLPDNVTATHRSLFDGSLQGIARNDVPAFSFQGHPEASPGPHDVAPLFTRFIEMIDAHA